MSKKESDSDWERLIWGSVESERKNSDSDSGSSNSGCCLIFLPFIAGIILLILR